MVVPDEFRSLIEVVRGCWMWTGPRHGPGKLYPRYRGGSATSAVLTAVGVEVNGRRKTVRTCGALLCVNPDHVRFESDAVADSEPARFWSHVDRGQDSACWPWTAAANGTTGYGKHWCNGREVLAHRRAFELGVGPIDDGLQVNHTCNNRRCCNPGHLYQGTQWDNMQDRKAAGHY